MYLILCQALFSPLEASQKEEATDSEASKYKIVSSHVDGLTTEINDSTEYTIGNNLCLTVGGTTKILHSIDKNKWEASDNWVYTIIDDDTIEASVNESEVYTLKKVK